MSNRLIVCIVPDVSPSDGLTYNTGDALDHRPLTQHEPNNALTVHNTFLPTVLSQKINARTRYLVIPMPRWLTKLDSFCFLTVILNSW